eukprot:TRINITY_DN57221_c0_g1_i1.p1 TRINITY_DN57221_c0_g1~~TRINITY_DN57221_c0_g1_i1.p1  ORF type:complete len:191 (-),score=7.93 TRINITY_DN57221_c0_g1_i1:181-753(-)
MKANDSLGASPTPAESETALPLPRPRPELINPVSPPDHVERASSRPRSSNVWIDRGIRAFYFVLPALRRLAIWAARLTWWYIRRWIDAQLYWVRRGIVWAQRLYWWAAKIIGVSTWTYGSYQRLRGHGKGDDGAAAASTTDGQSDEHRTDDAARHAAPISPRGAEIISPSGDATAWRRPGAAIDRGAEAA